MSNKLMTRAEWLTYLQEAIDKFDWDAAGQDGEDFKELNIDGIFLLRFHRTAAGCYQQTYTPAEFDEMQEWLDRALEEHVGGLEVENKMLRARNERLQRALDGIVPRLEAACGAKTMPPMVAAKFIEENT